ncbi:tetratricopeptide repeat protein [Methanoregula sp.]|jgi:tetratricopeptide (TPR) repeat protein|uniref:tetratricopeptide repeat protein n=1 Tax=Methanoregula sp. TaxID=2052170 RepID=UPI003C263327
MSSPDIPLQERAHSFVHQGKAREALDCYDQALRSDPGNSEILNSKAAALITLGRFEEALEPARKAASASPRSVDCWINLGVALDKLDRLHDASEALERAVEISPYNAYARALLGIVYQKMDMGDRAEAQNRKLQEIVFPHGYAGFYFATAAFLLGLLLGGIRAVAAGKPPEITISSQLILLLFFCVICKLYWRSLRVWQQINRNVIVAPHAAPGRRDPGSRSMYLAMAAMVLVFGAGILMGGSVWIWLH